MMENLDKLIHELCSYPSEMQWMTNASLRKRFGVPRSSSGSIPRLNKEAVSIHLIKPLDPTTSNKYMSYIPIWA